MGRAARAWAPDWEEVVRRPRGAAPCGRDTLFRGNANVEAVALVLSCLGVQDAALGARPLLPFMGAIFLLVLAFGRSLSLCRHGLDRYLEEDGLPAHTSPWSRETSVGRRLSLVVTLGAFLYLPASIPRPVVHPVAVLVVPVLARARTTPPPQPDAAAGQQQEQQGGGIDQPDARLTEYPAAVQVEQDTFQ